MGMYMYSIEWVVIAYKIKQYYRFIIRNSNYLCVSNNVLTSASGLSTWTDLGLVGLLRPPVLLLLLAGGILVLFLFNIKGGERMVIISLPGLKLPNIPFMVDQFLSRSLSVMMAWVSMNSRVMSKFSIAIA